MASSHRPERGAFPFHSKSEATDASRGARAEYIRIARALLGVTPAQLASQIGASPPPRASEVARPTQTLDRLSGALQAVIGWYHISMGSERPTAGEFPAGAPLDSLGLDTLVHEYLALRSKWEGREAGRIAARVADIATPPTKAGFLPTGPNRLKGEPPARTALLVDDASDVVVTVAAFLEGCGFIVLRATSGDEALQVLATGATIDLLITDHAMPGLTGKDLVIQACLQRPTLRALIITGFADSAELADLPDHVLLLAKPFRRKVLLEKIQELFAPNRHVEASSSAETPAKYGGGTD